MRLWLNLVFLCLLIACFPEENPENESERILRIGADLQKDMATLNELKLPSLPVLQYKPDLDANARYTHDTIFIGHLQAAFQSEDDIKSVLFHELFHAMMEKENRYPIEIDEKGIIVQWQTEEWYEYIPSDYRIEQTMQHFTDSVLPTYEPLTPTQREQHIAQMRKTVAAPQQLPFTYAPSNLSLEEIEAYQFQLKGEELGLYVLSRSAKAAIQERIQQQKDTWQRRKDYEDRHHLQASGRAQP